MVNIFSCAFRSFVCLHLRNIYLHLPIFWSGFFFFCLFFFLVFVFDIELHELFQYFRDKSLIQCIICKYSVPFCGVCFCFMVFFAVQKFLIKFHFFILVFILITLSCCHCSVTKSCMTFYNSIDCCIPGSSVLHYLPEFAQIHVYWVGDII